MREIKKILERYPQVSLEEINHAASSWCDPRGEMIAYIRTNVKDLKGFDPLPIVTSEGLTHDSGDIETSPLMFTDPHPQCG